MIIIWISVALTLVATGITVYVLDNLKQAIAMLPVLMGIRCCIGESLLAKTLRFSLWKDMVAEFALAGGFILLSWNIESWLSTVLYLCMYIIYVIWKRDFIKDMVQGVKSKIRNR